MSAPATSSVNVQSYTFWSCDFNAPSLVTTLLQTYCARTRPVPKQLIFFVMPPMLLAFHCK